MSIILEKLGGFMNKLFWISCADCSMLNEQQPCEACVNWSVQKGEV